MNLWQILKEFWIKKEFLLLRLLIFLNLVKNLEYDTVYHEHLSYITVGPLISFFKKFKLKIIKVLNSDIHGGSIRIYICREKRLFNTKSVKKTLQNEKTNKLNDLKQLSKFANKVSQNRYNILNFIINCKKNKKKIVALSAPAKGMTLLNFLRLDNHFFRICHGKIKIKNRKVYTRN